MHPYPSKVDGGHEWPIPNTATMVKQFLDLTSHYQWYIKKFADTAVLLHNLTAVERQVDTGTSLAFPQFTTNARPLLLKTDAITVGLRAVLAQGGCVIAAHQPYKTKNT